MTIMKYTNVHYMTNVCMTNVCICVCVCNTVYVYMCMYSVFICVCMYVYIVCIYHCGMTLWCIDVYVFYHKIIIKFLCVYTRTFYVHLNICICVCVMCVCMPTFVLYHTICMRVRNHACVQIYN